MPSASDSRAAVEVVKLALGDAVVDVDRRHGQRPGFEHLIEVMDARSRLFGDAAKARQKRGVLLVDPLGQVAAVVENQVGASAVGPAQGLFGTPPVFVLRLPLPSEDRDAGDGEGRGRVVLGREDVARTPAHLCPQRGERLNEHGGLDRRMQGASNPRPRERLGVSVLGAQGHQPGHLLLGENDFLSAPFGQR